jgi:hypothetical protein
VALAGAGCWQFLIATVVRAPIPVAVVHCECRVLRERRRGDIGTETWEAGGSSHFCLASAIAAHRSAAFASMALGAMCRVLLTPVPDAEPSTTFSRSQAEREHIL